MTGTRTTRAASGIVTGVIQYGVKMVFQLAMTPLLIHVAGGETLGAYAVLVQVLGYIGLLDLGFSYALVRYATQAFGHDDKGEYLSTILTIGRTLLLITNLIMTVALCILALVVGDLFHLSQPVEVFMHISLIVLAAWTLVRTQFSGYPIGLIAVQDMASRNLIATLSNIVRMIVSILLVVFGFGLLGMVLGNIAAEGFDLIACRHHFIHQHKRSYLRWGIPNFDLLREIFHFGNRAMLITISQRLIFYSDNLIVGSLFGAAQAGVYYSTQMPVLIGWTMILELSVNAAAGINELYARREWDRLQTIFLRLHRYNFIISLPFATGVLFLLGDLVRLWAGPQQFAGESMALALTLFAALVPVNHLNGIFATTVGHIRGLGWWSLSEGITNIIFSVLLGSKFGLPGVMWATTLASIPRTIYLHRDIQQYLHLTLKQVYKDCLRPVLVPVVASALALLLLRETIVMETWISFIIVAGGYSICYGLMVWRFILSSNERASIGRLLFRVGSVLS